MEFLAGLYTLLLVVICLLQALLLHRTGKPAARQDDEALKEWLHQQLEAQARVLEEKQAQQAQQNLAAIKPFFMNFIYIFIITHTAFLNL